MTTKEQFIQKLDENIAVLQVRIARYEEYLKGARKLLDKNIQARNSDETIEQWVQEFKLKIRK